MTNLLEIGPFYTILSLAMYLVVKGLVLRHIWMDVTIRKTRNILLVLAILFSPTIMTLALFFDFFDVTFYVCEFPIFGYILDWGILRWIRAIFEPVNTLDDLEYDPDITNVDIP